MIALIKKTLKVVDIALLPLVALSAIVLKMVRRAGVDRLPASRRVLEKIGVFPIINHYYEPLFHTRTLHKSLREDRELAGIDLNIAQQLQILEQFNYNAELLEFPIDKPASSAYSGYYYHNNSFESGDAEYLYNMIRLLKPARIIEIGAGFSTLMAMAAVKRNQREDAAYTCRHYCIEPYENSWLERPELQVIREVVEQVDKELFRSLGENDILFIDSSHMIRPQGDVLVEFLEILPILKSGVFVHVHDIFTPRDYLTTWVVDKVLFWNEQYLLEAFLSFNQDFKVIASLNHLAHHYPDRLFSKCPIYQSEYTSREPGSFWFKRI